VWGGGRGRGFILNFRFIFLRFLDGAGADWSEVLLIGTNQCPRSPELFHLAARLSLAHQSSDEATPTTPVDTAVQWLEQCVKDFYSILPEREVDLEMTLVLYRYEKSKATTCTCTCVYINFIGKFHYSSLSLKLIFSVPIPTVYVYM
jgi:hypothetical protein